MQELTKDADKMICLIYKSFLESRKAGASKEEAVRFTDDYFARNDKFSKWQVSDIDETLFELKQAGYVKIYITGEFAITTNLIIYMEKRFKNGLVDVVDFLSKFIP